MITYEPLITVIVPVYNVELYLRECITSVLKQTYSNIEVILVNDGSTDSSRSICEEYQIRDKRVSVINKENGGLSSARNCGLKYARGELISFIDSDDWLEREMYEKLVYLINEYSADVVACRYIREYRDGFEIRRFDGDSIVLYQGSEAVAKGFLQEKSLATIVMNKLYRRKIFDEGFRFPEGRNYEDITLMTELTKMDGVIVFINKNYYHYRQRRNSIIHSRTLKNSIDNWISRFERYQEIEMLTNDECKKVLIKECITAIYKAWILLFGSRHEQGYDKYINDMSCFAREKYGEIKSGEYPVDIKIMTWLARYNNIFIFLFIAFMHFIHQRLLSLKKFSNRELY